MDKVLAVVRKIGIAQFLLICATGSAVAYDTHGIELDYPSVLSASKLEAKITHRFYGNVADDPAKNAFGLNTGAFADVGVRYIAWQRFDAIAGYYFRYKDISFGVGYSHFFLDTLIGVSLHATVYNFESKVNSRATGGFANGAFSAGPFWGRVLPSVNVGFDGYDNTVSSGVGITVKVAEFLDVCGEYFPRLFYTESKTYSVNAFSFGLNGNTYHHQFQLYLGNTNESGLRRNMKGALDNNLHIGFTIKRLFDFN